jgi:hypothetical protein
MVRREDRHRAGRRRLAGSVPAAFFCRRFRDEPMSIYTSATRGVVLAAFVLAACAEPTSTTPITPTSGPATAFGLAAAPAGAFVPQSNNQYFPLVPGTSFHYQAKTEDGIETEDFTVTTQTKVVQGITTRVIEDIVRLDGAITEHTFDWFAQDTISGDVWYFGEDSRAFDPVTGKLISREGSWEAGKKGAQAGIIMEGHPQVGDTYREEFAPGVAEDMARVTSLDARANVPYGNFRGCLKTENFTPLDPDVQEVKYYCPGVGLLLEVDGKERNELISISH